MSFWCILRGAVSGSSTCICCKSVCTALTALPVSHPCTLSCPPWLQIFKVSAVTEWCDWHACLWWATPHVSFFIIFLQGFVWGMGHSVSGTLPLLAAPLQCFLPWLALGRITILDCGSVAHFQTGGGRLSLQSACKPFAYCQLGSAMLACFCHQVYKSCCTPWFTSHNHDFACSFHIFFRIFSLAIVDELQKLFPAKELWCSNFDYYWHVQ